LIIALGLLVDDAMISVEMDELFVLFKKSIASIGN
jgi:multidrug efflux pump subunit AcrB